MTYASYLHWLTAETPTTWWHDSADPDEVQKGLSFGATGVTTNPFLVAQTLCKSPGKWAAAIKNGNHSYGEANAEFLMEKVVSATAQTLLPLYESSKGKYGYVCAQTNPVKAFDTDYMIQMAERFSKWAPNIAVKLPTTAAGLDALDACAAKGITVAATVSFTVAQVIAIAERYRHGAMQAKCAGRKIGRCFPVVMIGRIDDYLREVARDRNLALGESDIRQAGLAIVKKAIAIYQERHYEADLLIAALRGTHHMSGLAGANVIMSIHPKIQSMILGENMAMRCGSNIPVADDVINRLRALPEFVKAYDTDALKPEDFITFGVTQRTLGQFIDAGWLLLESYRPSEN